MKRLSKLMSDGNTFYRGFGLVLFGAIARNYVYNSVEENALLEGLSPKRIMVSDDWHDTLSRAKVIAGKGPHTAYAYYPPEYLRTKVWTPACSVFAMVAIVYQFLTGELPYVGKVPEELLTSEEGLRYIRKKRRDGLDMTFIPYECRDFITKGLSLRKKDRYTSLSDTVDDYATLADNLYGNTPQELAASMEEYIINEYKPLLLCQN